MSVSLPVAEIRKNFDPLATPPWGCAPITIDEIRSACLEGGHSEAFPKTITLIEWSRDQHIARIAYLVLHGWAEPIEIDVGVPSLGCIVEWPVTDGNHRLAAAIARGDSVIAGSVAGDLAVAQDLFGVDCAEEPAAQI